MARPRTVSAVAARRRSAAPSNKDHEVARFEADTIIDTPIVDEMELSFLDYSMSVIIARALPDVRDGLKPVQRRIIYAMSKAGVASDKPHVKCATVVGEVMGHYHPHGDAAIYETLVRLAAAHAMRVPLVTPHGNFGSIDDRAAAPRYCVTGDTRVRLADGTSPRIENLVNLPADSEAPADFEVLDAEGKAVHVSRVFNSGSWPTKCVVTKDGLAIRGTHNHPLLCLRAVSGVPTLLWLRLDEIEEEDLVCIACHPWDQLGSDVHAYRAGVLYGAWVAKGWVSVAGAGVISDDKDHFNEVVDAYGALVGGARRVRGRASHHGQHVTFALTVPITDALRTSVLADLAGVSATDKFVPEAVWMGGPEVKKAFLMSLLQGASVSIDNDQNATIEYATYSARLVKEVQELLVEFGAMSTNRCHTYKGKSTEHRLCIVGLHDIRTFAENVGFMGDKQAHLLRFLGSTPTRAESRSGDHAPLSSEDVHRSHTTGPRSPDGPQPLPHEVDHNEPSGNERPVPVGRIEGPEAQKTPVDLAVSGYRFTQVVRVTDEAPADVYSLRVDTDDHSFLAGGFVNHNTEARMSRVAHVLTDELDEGTVDWVDNYDATRKEPTVLPAGFPNLLVNGATGIAVGMATNMVPHNLSEAVAACQAMLEDPDISLDELMRHIPGPDFPTGGIIVGTEGIREAYETGRGKITLRARAEVTRTGRRPTITVTELPYTVGTEAVIDKVRKLVNAKQLLGLARVDDLSDRKHGLRLQIECKSGFDPAGVLAELYRKTPLQIDISIQNVCLVNNQPQTLGLRELIRYYNEFRTQVVRRRTEFRRARAAARAHLLDGLIRAVDAIDRVVAIIKSSKDTSIARSRLMKEIGLDTEQTNAVLEMPLRRLTGLEITKLREELAHLKAEIASLDELLGSRDKLRNQVIDELGRAADSYGDPRRTTFADAAAAELPAPATPGIEERPCVVVLSAQGVLGRGTAEPLEATYSTKRMTKADAVAAWVPTKTTDELVAITSAGRFVRVPVAHLPVIEGKSRGGDATELVALAKDERLVGLFPSADDPAAGTEPVICLATVKGVVKRIRTSALARRPSDAVIGLAPDDEVAAAASYSMPTDGEATGVDLAVVTSAGALLRFPASSVRPQGAAAGGMAGVRLPEGARVLALGLITTTAPDVVVATTTDVGRVKATPLAEYPSKGRGTGGVRCHTLRRGETTLVAAWIGQGRPLALTKSGSTSILDIDFARRDATGTELAQGPIVAFAGNPRTFDLRAPTSDPEDAGHDDPTPHVPDGGRATLGPQVPCAKRAHVSAVQPLQNT